MPWPMPAATAPPTSEKKRRAVPPAARVPWPRWSRPAPGSGKNRTSFITAGRCSAMLAAHAADNAKRRGGRCRLRAEKAAHPRAPRRRSNWRCTGRRACRPATRHVRRPARMADGGQRRAVIRRRSRRCAARWTSSSPTPGRLLDHLRDRQGGAEGIEMLVLDEADPHRHGLHRRHHHHRRPACRPRQTVMYSLPPSPATSAADACNMLREPPARRRRLFTADAHREQRLRNGPTSAQQATLLDHILTGRELDSRR